MEDELIEPSESLIRPLAARYAKRFRSVERDDIAQELRLWWLKNQRSVKRYLEKGEERKLVKSLQRAAQRYCEGEKAAALGYRPEDLHYYNTGLLRDLLPMVWNPELITQDQRPDEGQGKIKAAKPANEGNNLLAMVADVGRAISLIENEQQVALFLHFGPLKYDHAELAEQLGTTHAAAKMRVQRALQALVEALGGESPFDGTIGTRRIVSNAQAAAITANQETG